ncbi:glycoside hydrolase family 15 protein [Candidatus Saccharibacteria bacterium]|nr:MAG: glycoside hydrolase family 15 protein [Candidatus Saccharibacteria bacterium]
MGRPVILGNGALTVGLNEAGLVHDFYYPYVGLDNLTTARSLQHRIGVFCDQTFSWVDDGTWTTSVLSETDALISSVSMSNHDLNLSLESSDFVDTEYNAFCRQIRVKNTSEASRSVRLFMHQVFEISRGGRGDTALYVPDGPYILDYKGRCSLIIFGRADDDSPFDQYCVGNYGIEGKEGSWKDAEDGELSGNAVEHGGVDSVLAIPVTVPANGETVVEYWVVAADSQYSAEKIHNQLLTLGLESRLDKARSHWKKWLQTAEAATANIPDKEKMAIKKSLMVIKAHTDRRGGVIASCDSSIYNYGRDYYSYVWPRDGAYAMWPLIRLGYTEEPKMFFEFCRDIMNPEGYMMHKYQPDKAIGSTWHPLVHGKRSELAIQEDETAIIIFMLHKFYEETGDKEFVSNLYSTMVQPMANFMTDFRDEATGLPHASYDLWEEKFLTNTYTTALTHRALMAAADFADIFAFPDDAVKWRETADHIAQNTKVFVDPERQYLRKGFLLQEDGSLQFDNTLDVSSAYGSMMFATKAIGSAHIQKTFEGIESVLLHKSPSGGAPRYEHDTYFRSDPPHMGNPWFVTTLWVACSYIQTNREDEAKKLVEWTLQHALPSGALSEQIDPTTGEPLSVLPLVWSHAELINTLLDLYG